MGKEGFEPSCLAAHDSKSRLSANSSTSPKRSNYMSLKNIRQQNHNYLYKRFIQRISGKFKERRNLDQPIKKMSKYYKLLKPQQSERYSTNNKIVNSLFISII